MSATKVNVEFLRNPRIANRNSESRITAIVGLGPVTRNIVDEAVVRGTGSVDTLSLYPSSGVSVSQISDFPGVISTAQNYVLISQGGVLYNRNSSSVNANGQITWPITSNNPDVPAPGTVYYVSYSGAVPDSQFNPEEFSDKSDILAKYGEENNNTGILSVAGTINLENGAPSVLLVQASSSSYNEAAYKLAIDKLLKRSNVEDVVAVFPCDGSVTRAQQEVILTYLHTHFMKANTIGRERGIIYGSPTSLTATGGIDDVGDIAQAGTYCGKANSLSNEDICYVVAGRVRRKDANGNYMELDTNFVAAAIGGLQASLPKRSTPMHEMKLVGFELDNEKFSDSELKKLDNASCLVVTSNDNICEIYDSITTDNASADTQEKSVITQKRLVKRSIREGLRNEFFKGKGTVVLPYTETDIEAKTDGILNALVTVDKEIYAYGLKDDPTTGERKTIATVDPTEPRRIRVKCSIKYLYALKWIDVEVSTFV